MDTTNEQEEKCVQNKMETTKEQEKKHVKIKVDTTEGPSLATNSILFLCPFCEKSLICLEGKSMTPCRGNAFLFRSSQQLPCLRLGPLKGFLS